MTLIVLLLLAQSNVVIQSPTNPTKRVTTTTSGSKELLDVNCPSCTGGSGGDGGPTTVTQGLSNDGGYNWSVSVQNSALPTGASTESTLALIKAKTDNLDVALSTRTKPADQQHVIVDTAPTTAVTQGTSPWVIGDGAGAITVDGTVTANQGGAPWSGNTTQLAGTAIDVNSGTKSAGTQRIVIATDQPQLTNALKVDGTATIQPVSGTVTANAGSNLNTSALALSATQTDGTQKSITRGGAKGATTAADVTSTANGADHNGLDVQVQNSSITVAQGTAANLNATVTGSVTANAGSNLNTSALALSATQTDRTQKTQITDGTRDGTVKPASTSAVAADTALVVALSPNTALPAGSNIIGSLAGNQTVNVSQVGGGNTATAASGVQKVGIVGNAAGAFDTTNNGGAPANLLVDGIEATSEGTQPTAATNGNMRRKVGGTDGTQFVRLGGPVHWSCFKTGITATTECQAAPAAGLRLYVTTVFCDNQAATVQTVDVIFGTGTNCGTGTTALTHKFQMGTNATTTSPDHVSLSLLSPLVPTAANAICVRPSAATAFGCTLTGYTAP